MSKPLKQKPRTILVGIPDNNAVFKKKFVLSLLSVLSTAQVWTQQMKEKLGKEIDIQLCLADMGWVDSMRNSIAKSALEMDAYSIMWLDSDMTFPPDIIPRFYQILEQQETDAVTGLYTYKYPPFLPHVYTSKTKEGYLRYAKNFPLDGLFSVEAAGFGCIMMKTACLKRVKKPYFRAKIEDGKLVLGEDFDFCKRAKLKILLDPKTSCGHIMDGVFGINDYIESNGLTVKDSVIQVSDEQQDKIMKKHGIAKKKKV